MAGADRAPALNDGSPALHVVGLDHLRRLRPARSAADMIAGVAEQPSNHSPFYAPMVKPTLTVGAGRWWRRRGCGCRCRRKRVLLTASAAAIVRA